jgi:hypothetical protein
MGFFQGFFRFFWVFLGFEFFWVSGFFWVLSFFQISSAPTGKKRNPHPNPVLRGLGSGRGYKNAPEPASVGCKTHG